jgi:hypothetical protein
LSNLKTGMRIEGAHYRLRRTFGVAALLAAAAILQGCGGGISLGGALPSWFSRSDAPASQAQASAATPGRRQLDEECPSVDIRTGAGTLSVAARNDQPTANDLRYQLTFSELARQCFVDGNTVHMRVGVQGRAVVGPAGAPPQVSVPIRYAVVQEGVQPKLIVTKFRRSMLALPPGTGNVTFTDIEEDLSFPMPLPAELLAYVVYVGFDDASDRQQPKAKKKAPRKR